MTYQNSYANNIIPQPLGKATKDMYERIKECQEKARVKALTNPTVEPSEEDKRKDAIKRTYFRLADDLNASLGEYQSPMSDAQTFDGYIIDKQNEAQRKALHVCKLFAERFSDRMFAGNASKSRTGLLLVGSYGTGKTHLANAICITVKAQGFYPTFMTAQTLFNFFRPSVCKSINALTSKFARCPLLVIDELGRSTCSEFERNQLVELLDARARKGNPTILITNLSRESMGEVMGGALMSRISSYCYPLKFFWEDRREKHSIEREDTDTLF